MHCPTREDRWEGGREGGSASEEKKGKGKSRLSKYDHYSRCPPPQVDVDSILRDIDSDHDGRINYEEFCNCLRHRGVSGALVGWTLPCALGLWGELCP